MPYIPEIVINIFFYIVSPLIVMIGIPYLLLFRRKISSVGLRDYFLIGTLLWCFAIIILVILVAANVKFELKVPGTKFEPEHMSLHYFIFVWFFSFLYFIWCKKMRGGSL